MVQALVGAASGRGLGPPGPLVLVLGRPSPRRCAQRHDGPISAERGQGACPAPARAAVTTLKFNLKLHGTTWTIG